MSDVLWEDMLKQPPPPPPPPPMGMPPPPMGGMPPPPGMGMEPPDPPGKIVQDKPGTEQDVVPVDPEKDEEQDEEEIGKSTDYQEKDPEVSYVPYTRERQPHPYEAYSTENPDEHQSAYAKWQEGLRTGASNIHGSPSAQWGGQEGQLEEGESRDAYGVVRDASGNVVMGEDGKPKYETSHLATSPADERAAYWQQQLEAGNITESELPDSDSLASLNPAPEDIEPEDMAYGDWKENMRVADPDWQEKKPPETRWGKAKKKIRSYAERSKVPTILREGKKRVGELEHAGMRGAQRAVAGSKDNKFRHGVGRVLWGDNYVPEGTPLETRARAKKLVERKKKKRGE